MQTFANILTTEEGENISKLNYELLMKFVEYHKTYQEIKIKNIGFVSFSDVFINYMIQYVFIICNIGTFKYWKQKHITC